ncbi:flagellin [Neokomagataea thailandica]|uniref:Flagellar hook-associated protein FlgL n=1 Tax=Neokomagataea tanensis NBRC 106556 TaxID=1223519 RepID=A0ABQ0QH28_9PROT|nr:MULTISPECIES: flagellin [Neokomagataea]GBR44544.1 flagellar hook-associated protein FlgL [Neokomagataea tanensis NBRC 106556]
MTGIVADMGYGTSFYGMAAAVNTLSARQDVLQAEVSTGVRAQDYAGLGASRTQALALQPAMTQVAAWTTNVQEAQAQLSSSQNALKQISDMSSQFTKTIETLVGTPSASSLEAVSQSARDSLTVLGNALNTKYGEHYIFSGNTGEPPVNGDLYSSNMSKDIASIVSSLGEQGGQGVLQLSLQQASAAGKNSPFSQALSSAPQDVAGRANQVQTGPSGTQIVGWVATQGGVPSAETTGSPIRDLMRNLMVVSSLGHVSVGSDGYKSLIAGIQVSNNTVNTGLANAAADMGIQQNTLTIQSSFLTQMNSSLMSQLGQAKDADIAMVSTQLTDTQNQLKASYSLIADMKGMMLANYI